MIKQHIELKTIESAPLHEKAYQEIRQALMAGKFPPGQKLTSRKLAAALGVSDMPVRSALSRLVAEGGLVQQPNSTMIVPYVGREKFQDVMKIRALLEGEAAALAARGMDPVSLRTALKHADNLEAAARRGDIVAYLDFNQQLKFSIYERCGSSTLLNSIRGLWLQAGPFLRHLSIGLKTIPAINHHRATLAAIQKRNPAKAREAISKDILEGMDFLLRHAHFPDDALSAVKALGGNMLGRLK